MTLLMPNTHLIIQGGGFRTAFTAGVLDAFLATGYTNFDGYLGVSGGSIALSYFLSEQYGHCYEALKLITADPHFVKMTRAMSQRGYMDIDKIHHIAQEAVPFNVQKAMAKANDAVLRFVVTDRETGKPEYLRPDLKNWVDIVIASCTMPFVTKGSHFIGKKEYFDGGWSDPIPVQRALGTGAHNILVLRTTPTDERLRQSWPDYLGSLYFRQREALSRCFARSHEVYNATLDALEQPPAGITIRQIAPEAPLKSGNYGYSASSVAQDYRYGLDLGLRHVQEQQRIDVAIEELTSS